MRSHMSTEVLLVLVVLIFAACAPPETEPESTTGEATAQHATAINNLVEEFTAAYNANEATAVADLFTDDAVLMPPNAPPAIGKEAIQAHYQAIFGQGAASAEARPQTRRLQLSSEEIEVADDSAFDRGSYTHKITPEAGGEPTEDQGKYLAIDKREPDGAWKIARVIWNSNNPLPSVGD